MAKSLSAQHHGLADKATQLKILSGDPFGEDALPAFKKKLKQINAFPLNPLSIEIFQMNLGYLCNQVCKHCHVDAGPDRREIMTRDTMAKCLDIIKKANIRTVDLTGGAPEMNPHFRWFVEEAGQAGVGEIIVRSNLTIILANPKYHNLPRFFRENNVRVVSSLPFYQADKTDRQRGSGVFGKSIEALKMLNAEGYGMPDSGLRLDLVYNPSGAFLPGDQASLEADFKQELSKCFNIRFNNLFTITNIPISRFLEFLIRTENYDDYMETLVSAFNPMAVQGVMCRNTLSIDYDGHIYDCDFNQMLGLKTDKKAGQHIDEFDLDRLENREIVISQHCYGCTAGAGSSCQGAVA